MSRLEHCTRSVFNDADDARGAETEDWIYSHLLCYHDKDDVIWHNQHGRSMKIDFTVLGIYYRNIEVERKARNLWHFGVQYGFDFLAPKVHQFVEWDEDVIYMLVKGDRTVLVCETVVAIMLYGEPIRKKTKRGMWEWFYRVPLHRLRVKVIER